MFKYLGRGCNVSHEFEEFDIQDSNKNSVTLTEDVMANLVDRVIRFSREYPQSKLNRFLQSVDLTIIKIEL